MENNDLKNINNIAKLSIKTLEYAEKKKEEIDKTGDNKNNFDKNDFSADDGIFYLGKNRDGVHRDETFATAKVDVSNQMKTDKKWFADTTNVLNVFKNDAVIQTADDGNGNMAVSGDNVDAQTETTTEEKLNIDSKNKTNTKNYLKNGEKQQMN